MTDLTMQYEDVGATARVWDEENIDLQAASGQLGSAVVLGFTPAVIGAADAFRVAWSDHVADLALGAEHRADGLRDALREVVFADDLAFHDLLRLGHFLEELR